MIYSYFRKKFAVRDVMTFGSDIPYIPNMRMVPALIAMHNFSVEPVVGTYHYMKSPMKALTSNNWFTRFLFYIN